MIIPQRPEGCVCDVREDEYGTQWTAPPEGCRVHMPWPFLGSSPTAEAVAADFPAPLVEGVGPCGPACECRGAP